MISIAFDVMGGDFAPSETLQGAYLALKEMDIHLVLLGPEAIVRQELKKFPDFPLDRVTIQDAPDVVGMSESPAQAFRKKKNSSIQLGLNLVKEKSCQGFVSAGNTGAVMACSVLTLGKIPGVERPAIATVLPSQKGPFVMLDMGSTVDCKPSHLAQFAVMGHYFAKLTLDIAEPRVALLNIGEERDKGNSACLEAYELIEKEPIQFIGNIEGKEILFGKADVIVCDGFVGNCLLKFGEGVSELFMQFFKNEAKISWVSALGLLILKPGLKRFIKKFDYQEYGGAPLLGVNGVSIIAHGKSKKIAVKNAILRCKQAIENQLVEKVTEALIPSCDQ